MIKENNKAPITAGHYALIRILIGSYLCIHFLLLLPYGTELFSSLGLLPAQLSPLLGIIPNPLSDYDKPYVINGLLISGIIFGVLIVIGYFDRIAGIAVVILLGWLYARNPLIANPSLPVVGWMLLAHAFLPGGAYGSWFSRRQAHKWLQWFYPKQIWIAAWVLLAVAYSYSGYTKLLSPSWLDGSAIQLVLENPLARDHFLRLWILDLPPILLQLLTWSVLIIELLFLFFCFWTFTRKWAWLMMLLIQFGFLIFLNFADLTFPMLLIHALTFDKRWLARYQPKNNAILFYDGTCGFCSGLVRFALSEDSDNKLHYSPLQGQTFKDKGLVPIEDDSIVVLTTSGEVFHKSDAAIYCLTLMGGIWLLIGRFISIVPRIVRDGCYDIIGKIRYRLAGKVKLDSCLLLPKTYRDKMLL